MSSKQSLDLIKSKVIESGKDRRYKIGGYDFVLNGFEFYIAKIGEKRHVTGGEFSMGLLLFAQRQFGPLARTVLEYWGIKKTDDFGEIVYNIISVGLMNKRPEDRIADFFDVISFESYFDGQDCFQIDRNFIKKTKDA